MHNFLSDVGDDCLQMMFNQIHRDDRSEQNLPDLSTQEYRLFKMDSLSCVSLREEGMRKKALKALYQDSRGREIRVRHFVGDFSEAFIQSKL